MPVDPTSPAYLFVQALLGETLTEVQLEDLDPTWAELIQAAQHATPINRRAALVQAKAGFTNLNHLLTILRPGTPAAPSPPAPSPCRPRSGTDLPCATPLPATPRPSSSPSQTPPPRSSATGG
jgi:hypothetical protein